MRHHSKHLYSLVCVPSTTAANKKTELEARRSKVFEVAKSDIMTDHEKATLQVSLQALKESSDGFLGNVTLPAKPSRLYLSHAYTKPN